MVIGDPLFANLGVIDKFRGSGLFNINFMNLFLLLMDHLMDHLETSGYE